jgi:hypothetical protein
MLAKAQIGKAGELLVQYRLLLKGIESAQMTTDAGIDLVAFLPSRNEAVTIQVKTNLKPKPGGGKGKLSLDWWVPCETPAQLIALVDLSEERVWMLTVKELAEHAQQQSKGQWHIYLYTVASARAHGSTSLKAFERYLLEGRLVELLGVGH